MSKADRHYLEPLASARPVRLVRDGRLCLLT